MLSGGLLARNSEEGSTGTHSVAAECVELRAAQRVVISVVRARETTCVLSSLVLRYTCSPIIKTGSISLSYINEKDKNYETSPNSKFFHFFLYLPGRFYFCQRIDLIVVLGERVGCTLSFFSSICQMTRSPSSTGSSTGLLVFSPTDGSVRIRLLLKLMLSFSFTRIKNLSKCLASNALLVS